MTTPRNRLSRYRHLSYWQDEYRESYGINHHRASRRLFFVMLFLLIAIVLVAWFLLIPSFPEYVHQWWKQLL